jgi:AcrR family transcriptional regulator
MDLVTEQRLARRAAILAVARQMIAEVGYEAVTVRDLAERCRVSVPTLYNQFGGKDGLLGAAIEDHFGGVLDEAPLSKVPAGYERLQMIVDQTALQLQTLSAFHQRLLEAFMSLDNTTAVQQRVAIQLSAAFERELLVMGGRRQLATGVVPLLGAEQMTAACIDAAVMWSSGMFTDASLTSYMRFATGLILLGLVRGKSLDALKTRVETAQRQLMRERVKNRAAAGKVAKGAMHSTTG